MTKRPRTQANLDAERRWKAQCKRVHLQFHLERDAKLLEWMRSQVSEKDLAKLIKRVLYEKMSD